MRPIVAGLAGLAILASAEDILIPPDMGGTEQFAIFGNDNLENGEPRLDFTVATPDADEWAAMTVDDFKKFKAIVVGDKCKGDDDWATFADAKDKWSAAITGNMAIVGIESIVELRDGFSYNVLQKNMINFAASGSGTGLYYAVPCHDVDTPHVLDELSNFGNFTVQTNPTNLARGSLSNTPHLVAHSPAFITYPDDSVIKVDFIQDVSNLFLDFPEHGPNGFEVAVITTNTGNTLGYRNFADGSTGAPFVVTRGAVPVGCSNGVYEGQFGEECDPLSPLLSNATGICDKSCKCLKDFPGVCPPPAVVSSSVAPSSTLAGSGSSSLGGGASTQTGVYSPTGGRGGNGGYTQSDVYTKTGGSGPDHGHTDIYTSTKVYYPPTSVGGYPSTVTEVQDVVGVEIVFIVEIDERCPEGQTVTVTETKTVSTVTREIHRTRTEGYPCYPCAFGQPKGEITTVFYDLCPTRTDYYPTYTAQLCHSCPYSIYTTELPGYTPGPCHDCSTYVCPASSTLYIPTYVTETGKIYPTNTYASGYPRYTYTTTASAKYVQFTGAAAAPTGNLGMLGLLGGLAVAAVL
ncbi:hypothetical protein GQ53DRAFT_802736 [Thozetella sp. PMI_491]|nr:hypothetical protein GQ53DRAFT_802736 [Thozetella sp. PMI_491]